MKVFSLEISTNEIVFPPLDLPLQSRVKDERECEKSIIIRRRYKVCVYICVSIKYEHDMTSQFFCINNKD